jgi:hypothetical protein
MASMREPRFEMTADGLAGGLLDAVDLADGLEDGVGADLGVAGHLFGEARRLVGVLCTWSMETSISFIELEVSSAVSESASTFRATSLME